MLSSVKLSSSTFGQMMPRIYFLPQLFLVEILWKVGRAHGRRSPFHGNGGLPMQKEHLVLKLRVDILTGFFRFCF